MIMKPIRWLVRTLAFRFGRARSLWIKLCKPRNDEFAEFLRRHGRFFSMGQNCRINRDAIITDPEYVRIGNNVTLSSCTLIGHDASIDVIRMATGKRLDSVGKVDIGDNVFVGYGVILLPGVTIGSNSIIAAGAVVSRDVAPGSVVAGVPARPIGTFDDCVQRLEARTRELPWADHIARRESAYDPEIEPLLKSLRVEYFYGAREAATSPFAEAEMAP